MRSTTTTPAPVTSSLDGAYGLRLDILRNTARPDCSNHGISAAANEVTLAGVYDPDTMTLLAMPKSLRVTSARTDAPAVVLTWHRGAVRQFTALQGGAPDFFLVPAVFLDPVSGRPGEYECHHTMFGGTFGWSSDSRFGSAVDAVAGGPYPCGPLRLHDRVE